MTGLAPPTIHTNQFNLGIEMEVKGLTELLKPGYIQKSGRNYVKKLIAFSGTEHGITGTFIEYSGRFSYGSVTKVSSMFWRSTVMIIAVYKKS